MKPHRTDRLSLWFGLLFLIFVLWWLLIGQVGIDVPTAGWFIAGGLIVFGVLGLVTSLRPRRREEPVSSPPVPEPEDW
jgi:hypothetical protein